MKFININEQKPRQNQIVLVKTDEKWMPYRTCEYKIDKIDKQNYFKEISQNRLFWPEDEIVGWAPLGAIGKEHVCCKDCVKRFKEMECPLVAAYMMHDDEDGWYHYFDYRASMEDNFYCAAGERKENE